MRRHKLPIGVAGSSLDIELALWGTKTHRVVLIEGSVQYIARKRKQSYKMSLLTDSRIKVVRLRGGGGQTFIQVTREQERAGRVAKTCYIYHGEGRDHSHFVGLTPSGYFKRYPGKSEA